MGATSDKMYFLNRGEVEVLVGPELKSVAKLGRGEVFVANSTATVRAVGFCDCRALHQIHFQSILNMFPEERMYFEKLHQERTVQSHKVQQQVQPQFRRRSRSSWLFGLFSTGSEDISKEDQLAAHVEEKNINSVMTADKVNQNRRHSTDGVFKSGRPAGTPSRRLSDVLLARRTSIDNPKTIASTSPRQSNQHDCPELGSTRLPADDDRASLDHSAHQEPQLPDMTTKMPGRVEVLHCRYHSIPGDAVGLQNMQKEESGEQPDREALAELAEGLMDEDLPATTAPNGKIASETEIGVCTPEQKKNKIWPPLMSLASSFPSSRIVRRLSNLRHARNKTFPQLQECDQDVDLDLQGLLPCSNPLLRASSLGG